MASENKNQNFIEEIITKDLENGTVNEVVTRFPPEPNGYLHIGHAKSICLNFGMAAQFGGRCNLRFDDTNPAKEETEYVEAIMEDVKWLGFEWAELRYASDYFEQFYKWALDLIKAGKAYVDDQNAEEIRANRGTLTKPGANSPYRDRSVEENLELFAKMTAGEFEEGSHVLRAKIDMASSNLNLRDPVIYRILKREHHRTGANGASTRCTTSLTATRTPSRASPIPSAPLNSRTTGHSTTGSSPTWTFRMCRTSMNLRVSTSPTR